METISDHNGDKGFYADAIPLTEYMSAPNEKINIYKGRFSLKDDETDITCHGELNFHWYPRSGVHFEGQAEELTLFQFKLFGKLNGVNLLIDNKIIGEVIISYTVLNPAPKFRGLFKYHCVFGDISIPVNVVRFSIPNLKSFLGEPIRYPSASELLISSARIVLETPKYSISIDKSSSFDASNDLLKEKGGYMLLCSGELVSRSKRIKFEESKNILECLQFFLSFINGSKTAPLFIRGRDMDQVIWRNDTDAIVQQYVNGISWTDRQAITDFRNIWLSFAQLWADGQGRDFLKKTIHWYTEANYSPVFSESMIILAQTGLELIFNWFLIEQQKIIIGSDATSLSASNKIRLLIRELKISLAIPEGLKELALQKQFKDGPDALVQIRNAIVHGNYEKRKKLNSYPAMVIFQVHQLGIWYLELAVLLILKYEGKYHNRTTGRGKNSVDKVPWAK
jgi:hypothetical protein